MFKLIIVQLSIFILQLALANSVLKNDKWTLKIVHTNDMHSKFEQVSASLSNCLSEDAENGKCYGGFARISTLVKQARSSKTPTLFLNAGDTYQGSPWFSVYKWKIVSKFLNLLHPDVISLGNHEFDGGIKGLLPFLKAANFPIVACNLDFSKEPELASLENLKKSLVLEVDNHKIGIIGYLTPQTKTLSHTGEVIFSDEIDSIKAEVKNLKAQGVNIIIALGHSGVKVDLKIAREVEGLDLVVGGHTHSFLCSNTPPDAEEPEDIYPIKVTQKSGRKVYVVQAFAHTKYFGNLTIDFDKNEEIISISGAPILVDSSIEEDEEVLKELEQWRFGIDELKNTSVGSSKVRLDGSRNCRRNECNLGNLIVDAMVDYNAKDYYNKDEWTDAAIAMHNSGTVKKSINKLPEENITMYDILMILPFNNEVVKVELTGAQILQVLEHSVSPIQVDNCDYIPGVFMHYSGIQVAYNLSQPSGSRVIPNSVYVRCARCRIPSYSKLEQDEIYKILTIDFLREAGDGYKMFKGANFSSTGVTTNHMVIDYFQRKSPVYSGTERRIITFN